MTKAMQERGIPPSKILGQGEITMDDNALKSMGDSPSASARFFTTAGSTNRR